jgi:acyl carrier protein
MNAAALDTAMLARIEKAFRRAFGARIVFHPALDRASEPRWTSLKHVEFIIALEGEFGVRFDGTDATDMVSIPAVCARLAQAGVRAG